MVTISTLRGKKTKKLTLKPNSMTIVIVVLIEGSA